MGRQIRLKLCVVAAAFDLTIYCRCDAGYTKDDETIEADDEHRQKPSVLGNSGTVGFLRYTFASDP